MSGGKVGRPQKDDKIKTGDGYRLANFLNAEINNLTDMTNEELAEHFGYSRPNIISMWKTGRTKVPLDKVVPMAELLGMDLIELLLFWFDQYVDREGVDKIEDALKRNYSDAQWYAATDNWKVGR